MHERTGLDASEIVSTIRFYSIHYFHKKQDLYIIYIYNIG